MSTVILANGNFPSADEPLTLLQGADRIVCCDGAAAELLRHGMTPTVVVGDLDSLSESFRYQLSSITVHVDEQETNDLSKAFRYCIEQGWTDLVIVGATGRREDHTLGNISLLADFAQKCPDIRMVTDDGYFEVMTESGTRPCRCGQQVSLFVMDAETPLTSEYLKYPLKGLIPRRWWQATLNETTADHFSLSFPSQHTVLLFVANRH